MIEVLLLGAAGSIIANIITQPQSRSRMTLYLLIVIVILLMLLLEKSL